jgi:hypothetical protein
VYKQILASIALVAVLVTAATPVLAQGETGLELREAISLAKSFFPETEQFKSFHSSVDSYDGRLIYHLYWEEHESGSDQHGDHLMIRVDGNAGLVVSYNRGNSAFEKPGEYSSLPAYGKDQSLAIATEFLKALVPAQLAEARLDRVEEPQIIVGKRAWPLHYTFTFVQYVNDIPFKFNNITVRVNADAGQVIDFFMNWQDYDFPAPEGIIGMEAAEGAFRSHGLKLVYLRSYSYIHQRSVPFLAYVLEEGRSLQIDAFTGEISTDGAVVWTERMAKEGLVEEMADSYSPWELREIELIEGLLTKEQAEAKARDMLGLPQELELRQWGLYREDHGHEIVRLWHLEWWTETESGYTSASVRLDAATGNIQNFYFQDKHNDRQEEKFTLTPAEAQSLAEAFLKKVSPDYYADTELVTKYNLSEKEPLPYSYSFNFERRHNGIPVQGDNLYVTVRHDKKIAGFSVNWYRGDLPSASQVLDPEVISDIFLRDVGLDLEYVLTYDFSGSMTKEVNTALVYWPKQVSSYQFNPHTGVNIDRIGKEIVAPVKPDYQDIAGHWAEKDIDQLVELGLLRLAGDNFRPDEGVTLGDLLKMLAQASGWHDGDVTLPVRLAEYSDSAYANPLAFGLSRGLLEPDEGVDPETIVTREVLAYYLAKLLGHGHTAKLTGIWTAPYADFRDVGAQYQGSVAITYAEGVMGGASGGRFLPKQITTRAQVAVTLARMLNMK